METKCLILLVMLSPVFSIANAGLWDPPITNPSFESVENGTPHDQLVGTWGYIIDDWFENESPNVSSNFWEVGSTISITSDGDLWGGAETGAAFYQVIGTTDDETTYTVKALIGDRPGYPFGIGSFSIYAGGTETSGADGISLGTIATLVDSAQFTIDDGTLVNTNVYEVTAELNSGIGYGGQILWLQVKSITGKGYFDRVTISSSAMASDPVPADGEPLAPVNQVMEWTAPTAYEPSGYNVYFSTDPNSLDTAKVIDGVNVTSYDPPGDLGFSTHYFWRVDPINPNDGNPITVHGTTWSFTTAPAAPSITAQPASITVPAGTTAELTVTDIGGTDYTWYLVAEPYNVKLSGSSATLSISNAQIDDEGYYYCVVSNSNGSATSTIARLMVQRLIGKWKLDGNLLNEVAGGGDGTATDPNYVTGVDGSGVQFYGDGRTIVIQGSEEYYNFYPQGMTASVWVKTSTSTWDGVVSKHYRPEVMQDWRGWVIDVCDSQAHFTVRFLDDLWGTDDDGDMFDGKWHLITAVIDPITLTNRIYIDGAVRNESIIYNVANTFLTTEPVAFGAETQIGQVPYTGILDEVSIWNYPLDHPEIAQQYMDYYPQMDICVEPLVMDFNGNCMVDIDDFARIAASWLECNIVPVENCQ